ncbi:MAG: C25 family cysteine peptidase [bacterium]|nr:C25 family cysteine peptidase [bacterium]
MKRISVFLLFILSFTFICSDTLVIPINSNTDYNSLTANFNDGYHYFMSEGSIIMPAQKFRYEIDGEVLIKRCSFEESERKSMPDARKVAGENPLPKTSVSKVRSKLISHKSRLPEKDFEIKIGYSGNKTIIYGYISDYLYEHDEVIKRDGKLIIEYSLISKLRPDTYEKSILIITQDSLKTVWEPYREFYPDYQVEILSIGDIMGLTASTDSFVENIRNYIKYMYENSGLKGVILGGPASYIPGIYVPLIITPSLSESDQIILTDKFYSCLDGTWNDDNDTIYGEIEDSADIFPDILLGRVPVENSADVLNFLNKVEGFRSISIDTFLGVASMLDVNTDGGIHVDNMARLVPITSPIKRLFESLGNLSVFTFTKAINRAPRFVSHDGHGNYNAIQSGTGYATLADMDALTNPSPVFMYSLSCLSAGYDHDCIGVHFLLSNGGGYYIGNSRYGWYTPYFPGFGTGDLYNLYFYKNLYNETSNPAQALNNVFKEFSYEISESNDWRWQFFTLNYFGDPMVSLSLSRPVSNLDVQQPIYKNGIMALTIDVEDSVFVSISSDTLLESKVLYPYDNLFFSRIDDSDSLEINIKTPDVSDERQVVYPQSAVAENVYLTNYEFVRMQGDTLLLSVSLLTDTSAEYSVSVLEITDTLYCIDPDTLMMISEGDTNITFTLILFNEPLNNSKVPIVIGSDTLSLQYGKNLRESVKVRVLPDKQNYLQSENGEFRIEMFNKNLLAGVKMTFENDTVLLDTFANVSAASFSLPFTVNTPSDLISFDFMVFSGGDFFTVSRLLTANDNPSYMDFEDFRELEVDSGDAYFHISSNRASSGTYSYFCGSESSPTYPSNYITGAYTDSFSFDTLGFLGFDAFIDIESGMDYIVVYLNSDTLYQPVITLSGREGTFKRYMFSAADYPLFQGKNTKLSFEFYSEDDVCQYEGAYIDNIVVPGAFCYTGTNEEFTYLFFKKKFEEPRIFIKNSTLLLSGFDMNDEYFVYDISGRTVLRGKITQNPQTVTLPLSNG